MPPLTDLFIRQIKTPEAKPKKYTDGGGLVLLVTLAGGKAHGGGN